MADRSMLVIYSENQSQVRRIVTTDDPSSYVHHIDTMLPGEGAIFMEPVAGVPLSDQLSDEIARITGNPKKDHRHAVVDDKGQIIATVLCDPLIDHVEVPAGARLVTRAELKAENTEAKLARDFADKVGIPISAIDSPAADR